MITTTDCLTVQLKRGLVRNSRDMTLHLITYRSDGPGLIVRSSFNTFNGTFWEKLNTGSRK